MSAARVPPNAAQNRTHCRSRSNPARPYLRRWMSVSRCACPRLGHGSTAVAALAGTTASSLRNGVAQPHRSVRSAGWLPIASSGRSACPHPAGELPGCRDGVAPIRCRDQQRVDKGLRLRARPTVAGASTRLGTAFAVTALRHKPEAGVGHPAHARTNGSAGARPPPRPHRRPPADTVKGIRSVRCVPRPRAPLFGLSPARLAPAPRSRRHPPARPA